MSSRFPVAIYRAVLGVVLISTESLLAQGFRVGSIGTPTGDFGTLLTVINTSSPANRDGYARDATFLWSNAPCPRAVKISFFRPVQTVAGWNYYFVTERGPFDVQQTTQTVVLDPPASLQAGYLVAITSLTPCGGPVKGEGGESIAVAGDVEPSLSIAPLPPSSPPRVLVLATDGGLDTPSRDQAEQVLIPLAVGEFDGAFGSHFVVELRARNDSDQSARIFRFTCVSIPHYCIPVALPSTPIPARTTVSFPRLDAPTGFKVGEFLWIDKSAAPQVFLSLRVRDTSRASSSAGVEIPTPRESAAPGKMRVQLLNVPVEPGFRHTLRIYTFDYLRNPSIVPANRLRIFDLETDAILVDRPIVFNGFEGEGPTTYTLGPYPNAYASFLSPYDALQGHPKVRVELESNFYKFWAFITVANDLTQEVTVITP